MKIVFITHYFPPLNSSGARRINAFAKYFAAWGHEVTVVTTTKSEQDGLLTEVVPDYLRLLEIDNWGKLTASPCLDRAAVNAKFGVETRSGSGRVLLKIKRYVMKWLGQVLDHRLVFALHFISPSLAPEVRAALSEADVIMSSCPPWPTHLAGWFIRRRFKKYWVADYRDQFSGNHILRGSVFSRPMETGLDRWLLKRADCVTVISEPMQEYYAQFHPHVFCIENGYDEGVFEEVRATFEAPQSRADEGELVVRYMGSITTDRIPKAFFQAIAQLNSTPGKTVVIEFYGESTLLREALSRVAPEAIPYVRFHPQLSYGRAIHAMLSSDALFFVETSDNSSHSARGVLTTKLFEYLAARKPVIAEISPSSLAARYIEQSGLGVVITTDVTEMQRELSKFRSMGKPLLANDKFIDSLSRKVKARELEQLLMRNVGQLSGVSEDAAR